MKTATFVIGIILIDVVFINWSFAEEATNVLSTEQNSASTTTTTDEHKILLDCQHSDYRTYIKCLKRQKRHHNHGEHDTGGTKTCFEDCGMDLCTSTKCVTDCHTRCMKRTKETRQIITQYETECGSNDCDNKAELPTTNITTNIDINNVINNHIPKDTPPKTPGSSDHPGTPGTGSTAPCSRPGSCGGGGGGGGGPGGTGGGFGINMLPQLPQLQLIPQIQLVPQVTFGLGIGSIGGCIASMSWPCVPQNIQPSAIDCSQCSNPFLRYRCDPSCYSLVNNPSDQSSNDPSRGGSNLTCRPPHCVGGTYQ